MLTLLALSDVGRDFKYDVNQYMTPEQEAAAKAAAEKDTAEFEATIADLPDEEKEGKRQEHAAQISQNQRDKELDDELAAEQDRASKAAEAFAVREKARKEREAAGDADEDSKKPLTRADIAEINATATAAAMKVANQAAALTIAKTLATSDKEAQLIVAKWANRNFPEGTPLQDQIEEMYAVTHRKRLIGERNEALRAAKNKLNVQTDSAATHRDETAAGEPKMSDADKTAFKQAGFVWDAAKRLYKKPLGNGKTHLYRDPKTGRTFRAA